MKQDTQIIFSVRVLTLFNNPDRCDRIDQRSSVAKRCQGAFRRCDAGLKRVESGGVHFGRYRAFKRIDFVFSGRYAAFNETKFRHRRKRSHCGLKAINVQFRRSQADEDRIKISNLAGVKHSIRNRLIDVIRRGAQINVRLSRIQTDFSAAYAVFCLIDSKYANLSGRWVNIEACISKGAAGRRCLIQSNRKRAGKLVNVIPRLGKRGLAHAAQIGQRHATQRDGGKVWKRHVLQFTRRGKLHLRVEQFARIVNLPQIVFDVTCNTAAGDGNGCTQRGIVFRQTAVIVDDPRPVSSG